MLSPPAAVPNTWAVTVLLQRELGLSQPFFPLVALARRLVGGALLRFDEFDGRRLRLVDDGRLLGRRGALPLGLRARRGGALGVLRVRFRSRGGLAFCY